jgi:hypothetical protein
VHVVFFLTLLPLVTQLLDFLTRKSAASVPVMFVCKLKPVTMSPVFTIWNLASAVLFAATAGNGRLGGLPELT